MLTDEQMDARELQELQEMAAEDTRELHEKQLKRLRAKLRGRETTIRRLLMDRSAFAAHFYALERQLEAKRRHARKTNDILDMLREENVWKRLSV